MKIRPRLAVPLGVAASATLALGLTGTAPAAAASAESSSLPSASVTDTTLTIQGTHNADVVTLKPGADASTLVVDLGAGSQPRSFARATFTAISVQLFQGDDTFSVDPQLLATDLALTVDGGVGDDTIAGSRGPDVLIGDRGDDTIRGGDGNDVMYGGLGDDNIDGQRGTDTEILGSGDDTALWLPGEGNDIIDGGRGEDTLDFIGSGGDEVFGIAANGSHALLTRNLGSITMDTVGVEVFDLAALGGADTVAVGDMRGTDLAVDNIDLSSGGGPDGQLDSVTVAGSSNADHVTVDADSATVEVAGLQAVTRITGNDRTDRLSVATGAGDDTATVSPAASAAMQVAIDLGADQL